MRIFRPVVQSFVLPMLHARQDLEHISVLIHRSPQRLSLATDGEEDLIQVPFVATARAATQFIGRGLTKCEAPLPHRFVGHDDPALCAARSSTVPKTEREAEIQPHRVADHLRGETEPLVIGSSGVCFHGAILAQCSAVLPS